MTPTFTAVFGRTFAGVFVCAEETVDVLDAVVDGADEEVGVESEDCDVDTLPWDVAVGVADVVVVLVVCRTVLD